MHRYDVSRSFVIAVALAAFFGVDEQEPLTGGQRVRRKGRKGRKGKRG